MDIWLLRITLLITAVFVSLPALGENPAFSVVVGPGDEQYLTEGWYDREGPYMQFDSFCAQRFRWGKESVKLVLPVTPKTANRVGINAKIGSVPGQQMTVSSGDKVLLTTGFAPANEYFFTIPADVVGEKNRVTLEIKVKERAVDPQTDPRSLFIAFASARVAPGEGAHEAHDPRTVGLNASPAMWRFCPDPKDQGDNFSKPTRFFAVNFDDSGWEVVRAGRWDGTGAVWYRGSITIEPDKPKPAKIALPYGGDLRTIYTNGAPLKLAEGKTQEQNLAEALKDGPNCIAVKLERWPEKMIASGDPSGIAWHTEDGMERTNLVIDSLPPKASVTITGPEGFRTYRARAPKLPAYIWLTHFGRYDLLVTSGSKKAQIPIHFLGMSFFHWGWYGPTGCEANGPVSNEFKPCSNKFMAQLLDRASASSEKHDALSHDGWIYEDPSTQPLTKRGVRGFAAVKERDYTADTARIHAEGKLDFVGMPYVSRSVDEADGEELVRSLRYSREIYKNRLSIEPHFFFSHDGSLTPQLPQIMQLAGYDTCVFCENWWGQGSVPNTSDCVWQSEDGTSVDVLDSYYHGYSVQEIAKRAAREGKPVALSAEEFACLDSTKFYEESDRQALEKQGIIIRPISLDRCHKEIAAWAASRKASKDSEMAYKGWTGGDPTETEYESLNREAEYRLAAAENLVSLARVMGYEFPQNRMDDAWKTCLIYDDCHTHWRPIRKEWRDELRDVGARASKMQHDAAKFIAGKVMAEDNGVVVVNSLGWKRSGLVSVRVPEGYSICDLQGKPVVQEHRGPDVLFWAADVPALGVKTFRFTGETSAAVGVSLKKDQAGVEISNARISVTLGKGGISVKNAKGDMICPNAELYFAKPPARRPLDAVSTWDKPLNPDYYSSIEFTDLKEIASGPAEAAVGFTGVSSDYPGTRVEGEIRLGAGADAARVSVKLVFDQPAPIGFAEAPSAQEGQYIPGIFFGFPCGKTNDIVVDKAYCLARDTLKCGNRETFMQLPFRFRTTNGLSLVAPQSGAFAVLTHGLTDFFSVPWRRGNLIGVSFGSGVILRGACPFLGEYTYKFSIYAPPPGELWKSYERAQEQMAPLETFRAHNLAGRLAPEGSLLDVDADNAAVVGVQFDGSKLRARVLELSENSSSATLRSVFSLSKVQIAPVGLTNKGGTSVRIPLPPRALREVTADVTW